VLCAEVGAAKQCYAVVVHSGGKQQGKMQVQVMRVFQGCRYDCRCEGNPKGMMQAHFTC
jgi:hypothetical protein